MAEQPKGRPLAPRKMPAIKVAPPPAPLVKASPPVRAAVKAVPSLEAAPPSPLRRSVIYRPGGSAKGNVVTTWPQVQAALEAANGLLDVAVDDSIAPAVVPRGSGVTRGHGGARLVSHRPRLSVGESSGVAPALTIEDGATLHAFTELTGPLTVQCECRTTAALSFDYCSISGGGPLDFFASTQGVALKLLEGAKVAAIQIPPDAGLLVVCKLGVTFDNSLAPTVPLIHIGGTATRPSALELLAYDQFDVQGDPIGGSEDNRLVFIHDDSIELFDSMLFFGTMQEQRASRAQWSQPSAFSSGSLPMPPNVQLGQVNWTPDLNAFQVWNGSAWQTIGPVPAPVASFIYRPGGIASGAVFTDPWQLALAALLTAVPVTIYVDCSMQSPAPWPVDLFLPNVTFAQSPAVTAPAVLGLVAGENPFTTTPSAGTLLFITALDGVGVVNVSTTAAAMVRCGELFGLSFAMRNGAYIERADASAPMALSIVTTSIFELRIDNCQDPFPNLAAPAEANVALSPDGGALDVVVTNAGPSMQRLAFAGNSTTKLNLSYDASVPPSQLAQTSWEGDAILVPLAQAASIGLTLTAPDLWREPLPTTVQDGMERMAALLVALNGGNPIP